MARREDIYFSNPALRNSFATAGAQGQQASNAYLQGALTYNPLQSLKQTAEGAYGEFSRRLGRDIGTLRGRQVGMGRLNTGLGTRDEDRVVTDLAGQYQDRILGASMDAERMRFANMQGLGQFGSEQGGQYRQGIADLEATKRDREQQERASKRSMWGNIISGIGTGAALAFSDETLKEDIEDVGPVLPRVRKLRGKKWNWNEEGRRLTGERAPRQGVIAQDVEPLFPELTRRDKGSGKLQVDYGGLASTVITALGEMDERIDRLKVGPAATALAGA